MKLQNIGLCVLFLSLSANLKAMDGSSLSPASLFSSTQPSFATLINAVQRMSSANVTNDFQEIDRILEAGNYTALQIKQAAELALSHNNNDLAAHLRAKALAKEQGTVPPSEPMQVDPAIPVPEQGSLDQAEERRDGEPMTFEGEQENPLMRAVRGMGSSMDVTLINRVLEEGPYSEAAIEQAANLALANNNVALAQYLRSKKEGREKEKGKEKEGEEEPRGSEPAGVNGLLRAVIAMNDTGHPDFAKIEAIFAAETFSDAQIEEARGLAEASGNFLLSQYLSAKMNSKEREVRLPLSIDDRFDRMMLTARLINLADDYPKTAKEVEALIATLPVDDLVEALPHINPAAVKIVEAGIKLAYESHGQRHTLSSKERERIMRRGDKSLIAARYLRQLSKKPVLEPEDEKKVDALLKVITQTDLRIALVLCIKGHPIVVSKMALKLHGDDPSCSNTNAIAQLAKLMEDRLADLSESGDQAINELRSTIAEIIVLLKKHSDTLNDHGSSIAGHANRLNDHKGRLDGHDRDIRDNKQNISRHENVLDWINTQITRLYAGHFDLSIIAAGLALLLGPGALKATFTLLCGVANPLIASLGMGAATILTVIMVIKFYYESTAPSTESP